MTAKALIRNEASAKKDHGRTGDYGHGGMLGADLPTRTARFLLGAEFPHAAPRGNDRNARRTGLRIASSRPRSRRLFPMANFAPYFPPADRSEAEFGSERIVPRKKCSAHPLRGSPAMLSRTAQTAAVS